MGLLVRDQGAHRGAGAVDAVLETGLPECLVAAEEGQVDALVARGLDVRPLAGRPVLVVTDRQERLVLLEVVDAQTVGVNTRQIADVVAVRFQEADHRILGVPDEAALAEAVDR